MFKKSTHRSESNSVTAELQWSLKVSKDTHLPYYQIANKLGGLNIEQGFDEIAQQE